MPFISEEEIFGTSKNAGRTGFIPEDDILKAMVALVKPKVKLKRIFKRK